jgi:hypothetical protein
MEKKLKAWQGWLLFGGTMVVVFVLGLIVASLMEHRAEVVSIYNNRKVDIKGIEARNEIFRDNFHGSIKLGQRRQIRALKVNSMAVRLWMCWNNAPKW